MPRLGVEWLPPPIGKCGAVGRPTKGTELVEEIKVGSLIMFLFTVMRRLVPLEVPRPFSALGVVRPLPGADGRGPWGGAGDGGNVDMVGEGKPKPPADGPIGGRGEGRGAPIEGDALPGPDAIGGGIVPALSLVGTAPSLDIGPLMTGVGGARPSK